MIDRENIINNFKHEVNKAHGEGWDFVDLSTDDAKEILELLKEQEPTRVESVYYGTDMFKRYRCPTCKAFFDHKYNYCPNCGKKVKWDG